MKLTLLNSLVCKPFFFFSKSVNQSRTISDYLSLSRQQLQFILTKEDTNLVARTVLHYLQGCILFVCLFFIYGIIRMPQLKLSRPFDKKKFTLLQLFNY